MLKSLYHVCLVFLLAFIVEFATCETKLEQLKALYHSLPMPVAYYPLMKEFSLRDGSGNGLDGSFSGNNVTAVTGPFDKKDTAFETGVSASDRKYMSFTSPRFSFGASSWTMSLWVNPKDKVAPIFDYRFPGNNRYAHLWIHDTAGKLYGSTGANDFRIPCTSSTWIFVAMVYDSSAKTTKIFCDNAFGNTANTETTHIKTRPTFTLGYKHPNAADYQFACLQVYSTAFSAAELLTAKSMCPLYEEAIDCPIQKCQTDTCRPDLSAPNGYTCAGCLPGWSGSDCQTPVCGNACDNGGTCVAPGVCACATGWQEALCRTPICLRACTEGMECSAPGICSPKPPWPPGSQGGHVVVYGPRTRMTSPTYIGMAKCFWIVYGELAYDEAIEACRLENGELAVFDSLSQDRTVRQRLNWNEMPGYLQRNTWVGQLWLGAKRQQTEWQWSTGAPFTFDSWIGDPGQAQGNQNCVVAQQNGWRPIQCNVRSNRPRYQAGAICQRETPVNRQSEAPSPSTCGSVSFANGSSFRAIFVLYPPQSPMSASSCDFTLRVVMRKSFFLVKGRFTWDSAGRACQAYNGTLAMLKSNTEIGFALKNIDLSFVSYRAWIGLRRPSRGASSFVWIDETENANVDGFLPGQPNNTLGGNQDCAVLVMNDARKIGWSDFACNPYGTPKAGSSPISALCESVRYL